jgi:hypothetical protein
MPTSRSVAAKSSMSAAVRGPQIGHLAAAQAVADEQFENGAATHVHTV